MIDLSYSGIMMDIRRIYRHIPYVTYDRKDADVSFVSLKKTKVNFFNFETVEKTHLNLFFKKDDYEKKSFNISSKQPGKTLTTKYFFVKILLKK
jgi:hypothetical protein